MTADIRAAFREAWDNAVIQLDENGEVIAVVDSLFDLDDFRESETRALDALTDEARTAVRGELDAILARYRDLLEEAVVRFAAEHPDAPRAKEAITAA